MTILSVNAWTGETVEIADFNDILDALELLMDVNDDVVRSAEEAQEWALGAVVGDTFECDDFSIEAVFAA